MAQLTSDDEELFGANIPEYEEDPWILDIEDIADPRRQEDCHLILKL